jgi:hypothetical protein
MQRQVLVRDTQQLRAALREAKPSTRIELAPGEYQGGLYFEKLRGEVDRPIIIAAADARQPPLIKGGGVGMQLPGANYVELRHLHITGAANNGLSIDDAGTYDTPAHHITLRNLKITDIGPRGNHDGIKLSGVDDFRVENCRIERWGQESGSGIDMVGCHRGVIEQNVFVHAEKEEETGGSGVQAKGGCRDILIRRNRFEHAGSRAINIGGSTGLQFFRPPLDQWPQGEGRYEAKDIRIEGNTFIGSGAPLAFAGVDGAMARFNTIYVPQRWALRILQETTEPGFVPSRNGIFSDNIVVFRTGQWFEGGVNIGPGTEPQSFRFARNFWFNLNEPGRSSPRLPTPETGGVYGQNPLFRDAETGDLRLKPQSRARKMGAEALPQKSTTSQSPVSSSAHALNQGKRMVDTLDDLLAAIFKLDIDLQMKV